jgi:transcriptional regulator with XRE-family HTH domain
MTTRAIGKQIVTARKGQQLKQQILAQIIGCTRSYVSKLEQGNTLPSSLLAAKLENALNMKKGALVSVIQQIKQKEITLKKQAIMKARGLALRDGMMDGNSKRTPRRK